MMMTNFYDPASAGLSYYNSHFNITLSKCSIEIQHKYGLRSWTKKDLIPSESKAVIGNIEDFEFFNNFESVFIIIVLLN